MRVMTFNANGIRSAARKGFFDWLDCEKPDVVCIQETKAQVDQLTDAIFSPQGYEVYYYEAQKKGYSGTALYSRVKPQQLTKGFGWPDADNEGRYIQADYKGLSIVSLYLPSGSSGEERQQRKFAFMDVFMAHLKELKAQRREFIICGDWNICHKEIDLKNWKANQKNSGFLPEERSWLDTLFNEVGFVDAFRVINKEADQYTWWSNRGQARAKNVGWRLDYHATTPGLTDRVKTAHIYTAERFSDHAPLTIEYDWELV